MKKKDFSQESAGEARGYQDNEDEATEETIKKLKKQISKDRSDSKEFEEDKDQTFDEKKISRLAKISNLLRKSLLGPQKEPVSKFSDLKDRTIWTVFMLFGFIGFISAGNFYCALLVLLVMMAIFSELIDLSNKYREINQEIKYYYFLNW